MHNDDAVAPWYDGWRPSRDEADDHARWIAESWRLHGVHKWIAYERGTGDVVGRGGLSRTPIDDDWGQIYTFLPDQPWALEAHESEHPLRAHANWLEIGRALRRERWGQGYAAEIGAAGLAYAFDTVGVRAVVSCTARHNLRSQAVMERIGMRYVGDIQSRGMAEGEDQVRDDAPFAVCVALEADRTLGASDTERAPRTTDACRTPTVPIGACSGTADGVLPGQQDDDGAVDQPAFWEAVPRCNSLAVPGCQM